MSPEQAAELIGIMEAFRIMGFAVMLILSIIAGTLMAKR